ncbi:MAG: flagellar biosynthetic protein FliO [Candidatus Zixiibacteriota bacterium]|nr:MAG: flagellar biosynthetic protein FliO [candidate division Zixibacteria bacterium]
MNKINSNRRMLVTVAVIVFTAVVGLMFINTGKANAELIGMNNADGTVSESDNNQLATSVVPSLLKIISALVIVLVAIYLSVYLLKKTMGKKFSGNKSLDSLEVIETTYVAPKKTISLVRVGNKSVLVGVTEQNISMLTELTTDETDEILSVEQVESTQINQNSFKEFLSVASNKVKEFSHKGKPLTVKS